MTVTSFDVFVGLVMLAVLIVKRQARGRAAEQTTSRAKALKSLFHLRCHRR